MLVFCLTNFSSSINMINLGFVFFVVVGNICLLLLEIEKKKKKVIRPNA